MFKKSNIEALRCKDEKFLIQIYIIKYEWVVSMCNFEGIKIIIEIKIKFESNTQNK